MILRTLFTALVALVVLNPGSIAAAPAARAAALATPTAVALVDAIAPGRVGTQFGFGSNDVSVPSGGVVTFMATMTPALAGSSLEIWAFTAQTAWRRVGTSRIGSDGAARYVAKVSQPTVFQARLQATSAHRSAISHGRTAAIDALGRTVVRVSCSEVAAWGAGSVAARAIGVAVGSRVVLSLCRATGRWTIADADSSAIQVTYKAAPASGGQDLFDLLVQKAGSRAVRLVAPAGSVGSDGQRALLVLLEAPPVAIGVTANVALTQTFSCGSVARCTVQADVYAPKTGGPWPVVVFLRGGPGGLGARSGYADFAARLAAEGVVVYSADYRDEPSVGGRYPLAFADAACAVRVARLTAGLFGGNRAKVTLVGHSLGAYVGSIVSLSANAFASSCHATGKGAPDTFIGISGPYELDQPNLQGNFASVLGGTRLKVPYAWQNGDPFYWIGRREGVRFRIVQGSDDPTVDPDAARSFEAALEAAGFDSALTMVAHGTHVSVISPAKGGDWAIAVILAALR